MLRIHHMIFVAALMLAAVLPARAQELVEIAAEEIAVPLPEYAAAEDAGIVPVEIAPSAKAKKPSIYELPYSLYTSSKNWNRLWVNSGVFAGAFVSTLFVLELLPENATNWNRASIQKDPFYRRWYNNVIKKGPEWDGDNPIFNYVLHPYAGAVYFMSARSCGFNYFQSLAYAAIVSNIGWEFGIEACMERPSMQDLFVTPLIGSLVGEGFYVLKRHIVSHDYELAGSKVLGNIVAFLIDPVNEVVGLMRNDSERKLHLGRKPAYGTTSCLMPSIGRGTIGFSFSAVF